MMALSLFSLLLLHYFLQTSLAKPLCTPSACGIIRNISNPFRLKGDPAHCGDRRLELSCENNVTFFTRNSHKYTVKKLNYVPDFYYLRVADPSVNINDTCSFPNSSSVLFNSVGGDYLRHGFYIDERITFISCSHPLKNSSTYIEVTHCATFNSSPPRFTYVKVGGMSPSEIQEMCKVEMIFMTLWPGFPEVWKVSNISLEDIHKSLVYGFEFHFDQYWNDHPTKWDKFITTYEKGLKLPLLIVLVILVVFGAAMSPIMTIIGFTVVLGLLMTFFNHHYHNRILGGATFDPLDVYTGPIYDARFDGRSIARNDEVAAPRNNEVRSGQLAPEKNWQVRNDKCESELCKSELMREPELCESELMRVRKTELEAELLRRQNAELEPELQFKGPVTRLRAKRLQGYFQVLIRKKFEDLEDARCSHALVNLLTNEDRI